MLRGLDFVLEHSAKGLRSLKGKEAKGEKTVTEWEWVIRVVWFHQGGCLGKRDRGKGEEKEDQGRKRR